MEDFRTTNANIAAASNASIAACLAGQVRTIQRVWPNIRDAMIRPLAPNVDLFAAVLDITPANHNQLWANRGGAVLSSTRDRFRLL